MRIAGSHSGALIFLPGFMSSAESYRALLEPVAAHGPTVIVPQLYKRGPAALFGRVSVAWEAAAAADLVRDTATEMDGPVSVGGHSRGGQAAWLAASLLSPELPHRLVLIDPVDGEGRNPSTPTSTVSGAAVACPTLVVGAGIGGRCAPEPVNHHIFAAATPHSRHVVVEQLGHADMLNGRSRDFGRTLCTGAADPDPGRDVCSALISAFLEDTSLLDDTSDQLAADPRLVWLR